MAPRARPAAALAAAALAIVARELPVCFLEAPRRLQGQQARGDGARHGVIEGGRRWAVSTAASAALQWPTRTWAEASAKVVKLNNGLAFPAASFGPQVYSDDTCRKLTRTAVEVGYRNFFASVLARNQVGFAQGIRDSGIARDEIFICGSVNTKGVRGFENAYRDTKAGCDANLKAFAAGGIDYVDMIMLDYPGADCDAIKGQWKAFEEMLASGKTKSLAVSNFRLSQLDCLLQDSSLTPPTVNQLRFNAEAYSGDVAAQIVAENRKRGVLVQAWSPVRVSGAKRKVAEKLGKAKGKSFAQVLLRWIVQSGATYTTQSSKAERLAENVQVFDFELSGEEMQQLSA